MTSSFICIISCTNDRYKDNALMAVNMKNVVSVESASDLLIEVTYRREVM